MSTKSRITSILKTPSLDSSITGLQTFNLSELNLASGLDFALPTNLRLGHLAESIVSGLFKLSTNYKMIYKNVQIIEDKKTIGEIDFIVEEKESRQLTHVELAYKFYLYVPSISTETINNWIGPNRNDSLKEKLEKIKNKQFPLLYHNSAKSKFDSVELNKVSQALCLLVSLYIPYEYKESFSPAYKKGVKGYYVSMEKFISLDLPDNSYYLPAKKEWGMDPSENTTWSTFSDIEQHLKLSIKEKQAPLCWQKSKDTYLSFFVVWW